MNNRECCNTCWYGNNKDGCCGNIFIYNFGIKIKNPEWFMCMMGYEPDYIKEAQEDKGNGKKI